MVVSDAVSVPLAFWLVTSLRIGHLFRPDSRAMGLYLLAVATALPVFLFFGLYRVVVRYVTARAVLAILAGATIAIAAVIVVDYSNYGSAIPLSPFLESWVFAVSLIGGSRWLAAILLNADAAGPLRLPVLIYGAGQAGVSLANAMRFNHEYRLAGFIDDNPKLHGSDINGVRVYSPNALPELVIKRDIRRVLLALPSQSRSRRREILARMEPLNIHVQIVPEVADIMSGRARIEEIREIDVRDLLGREPVPANPQLLDACIRGKNVLVTGAGGSIGAELCRQILQHGPLCLVLLENSEAALYKIERELMPLAKVHCPTVKLVPLIGNAHHKSRVREILQTYLVQTIYHAAAYKHVPLVESNMIEGIHNNVITTWYTAEAAMECGVETFVLVSTDKAVNPSNVMGATKRFSELVLQALNERSSNTKFCIVRFGNVLASSGSVVPLFQQQIRDGGPITVTHPDVIRYFMTIEEAVLLVIQAGSIATGGDVFVLDMGKPIRILDLAHRMVTLMGMTVRDAEHPDGDIEVVFTGLRPAEKLYEELLIGSNVSGTEHPRILRAVESSISWEKLNLLLREFLETMQVPDCKRARELLMEAVREYKPGEPIQDLVWMKRNNAMAVPRDPKVTDIHSARGRLQ